ncbi:AAA family ATPase [Hazenella sp. IB182357]|uniref:AAA family ATPase n=1 Tax=Polycladospora coralii TaxID=2771432 RepID=A0A926ND41_9BACL|nr:FtsK/SpoIIIE domain-containing protein [Polycladospora coralii]MBD1371253.1 AAA family ATPase [Polycladospora coralii]
MKTITFYQKKPGVFRFMGWLSYGITPWLAPLILPLAIISDRSTAGAISFISYSSIAIISTFPDSRKAVHSVHQLFWGQFRHHLLSRQVSKRLRETLLHAGLVKKEHREITGSEGRTRRQEILHYPCAQIHKDKVNIYIQFKMIPGQTEQEWERKVNAFAHSLGSSLISFQISRGIVEITLQYGEIKANSVTYKTDTDHNLALGYATGGKLTWDFEHFPHALIIGPTGTGKSTFIRNLLVQLRSEWIVKVADGKQVEFTHLQDLGFDVATDTSGFIRLVEEAQTEVDQRFKTMETQRKNHYSQINEKPYFLVIDEAIYLLEALSTKKDKETGQSERERILGLLRDISLRGRAAGVQLIMIFQRPDSTFMPTVIRDNLTAKIVLGGSETALEMAFGRDKSKQLDSVTLGHGYACIGDGRIELFRFPDYAQSKFLDDLEQQRSSVAIQ